MAGNVTVTGSPLGPNVTGSRLGNSLQTLLAAEDIAPGDEPSYQLCKVIYAFHPLGAKMVDSPLSLAQSQKREIAIPKGPEERLREKFQEQWQADNCDRHIFNTARLARMYGIASCAVLSKEIPPEEPLPLDQLSKLTISFNEFDPLNTAGSLVLNQDPNSLDYQKTITIRSGSTTYHRSRSVVIMNEAPLYIEYTQSAFGFVGRSVYQRALFPLKSFVQTMVTDDMVSLKAGVLIAAIKQAGSIVTQAMAFIAGIKRAILQQAQTNNVISISPEERIETLNMQNVDGAYTAARTNILKNTATAADMPAKLLENETMVAGFGEGVEDAKNIARYIERIREWLQPLYDFHDKICMHRAWSEEFYATIQHDFPEYAEKPYTQAFYEWANSFTAQWPNLLIEPDSERIQVDNVKLQGVIALVQILQPGLDAGNQVRLVQWAVDNFNEMKLMFGTMLELDYKALEDWLGQQQQDQEDQMEMQLQQGAQGMLQGEQQMEGQEQAMQQAAQMPPTPRPDSQVVRLRPRQRDIADSLSRLSAAVAALKKPAPVRERTDA